MMVTTPSDVNLQHWIGILQNKTSKVENRVKAYQTITGFMKDGDGVLFDGFVTELVPVLGTFLQQIYADCKLLQDGADLSLGALQAFGFLLFQDDITKHLSEAECSAVLDSLCDVIYETNDKNACTRALWCLSKQTLRPDVVAQKIDRLVSAIEHGQCKKMFKSMTVEHEALNALIRLLEQVPKAMGPLGVKWGPLVYGPLVHGAPLVRDKALVAMHTGFSYLMECQDQLAKRLAADLKAEVLITEMKRLLKNGQESHVLTVWIYYVKLLGKTLHSGSLINHLLPIVEQGFKNPSPKIKVQAYKAWETLIDNFALNPDIIGDHKRVKLLMQVFKINNAKFENVAMAKLLAWWHFVVKLEDKLVQYFEQVCVPLLTFCVCGSVNPLTLTPSGKNTKHTPNMPRLGALASPGTPSSPGVQQNYRSVQLRGVQVLAQIIGRDQLEPDNPKPQYDIALLKQEVLPGIHFFLKHEKTLVGVVMQVVAELGDEIQDPLLYYLWQSLVQYIHLSVEVTSKKEHSDCLSHFCTGLREVVSGQALNCNKILKLLYPVVNLPEKCLSSLAYQIDGTGVLNQGCPALFLIQVLLNHRLLETSSSNERFLLLLEKLIGLGFSNETASLSFCESVLTEFGQKVGNVESRETLWRMWSVVAGGLSHVIKKSNEVNQGNNLDHDFSALYATLTFPDLHIISKDLPQNTLKALLKTWGDLYTTFSRLAAMVATVQANLVCEELCALILEGMGERSQDAMLLEGLAHQCEVMVKHIDFSAYSQSSLQDPSLFFGKKKELGNLTSFVQLLDRILKAALSEQQEPISLSSGFYVTLVSVLSSLFTHISTSHVLVCCVGKLGESLGCLLKGGFVKAMPKSFSTTFNQKCEKLWTDISGSLLSKHSGPYDSDLLKEVSPMLEATFLHPRRAVKNQAMVFWNGTFSKSQALEYPDSLKHVLVKVKEKGHITLPGFDASTVTVLDNTLGSQTTQGESQFAVPVAMSHKSPKKEFGSFLSKVISPKKSPLKSVSPSKEGVENKRKKQIPPVNITDMNSKDFVLISTTPKRKRVLTEHQREVMKEQRGNIPALYSNLEASMDASLMGQLNGSLTQGESQMGMQSPESIQVTPFPFMKVTGQTTQSSGKVAEKVEDQKATVAKDENQEEIEENPRKRRRRSVRFSDDNNPLNISSEEENHSKLDKNSKLSPGTDKKLQDAKNITPPQDPNSRRSKRIKSQVSQKAENSPGHCGDKSENHENPKTKQQQEVVIEVCDTASDSVVLLGEKQKEDSRINVTDICKDDDAHVSDSGVICDAKICDTDSDSLLRQRRTSKRLTAIEINAKKCDSNNPVKASPAKIQGGTKRSTKTEQKETSDNDSAKNDTIISSNNNSKATKLTKKNSSVDSEMDTCNKNDNVVSQDLNPNPVKTRQLKLSDIVTPPRDDSLLKSSDSEIENVDQSKGRKSRSGSLKTSQSDSDSSNIFDSPNITQIEVGKSRSSSKSSQSDSDTCNIVTDSPRKTVTLKQSSKSPVKSPMKKSKSVEIKSPNKFKSPKKLASLQGLTMIDKWFTKSSSLVKNDQKNNDEIKNKSVITTDENPSKTLFSKSIETQSCTVSLVRVDPVVMAEDTQQFSPAKSNFSRQPVCKDSPTKQVSIVETPMKEVENQEKGIVESNLSAVRQLKDDLEDIGGKRKDVVLETQDVCSEIEKEIEGSPDKLKNEKRDSDKEVKEQAFFKASVAMETDSDENGQNNETLEDVMDDIIPSSQDSFGFSSSFSGRKSGNNTCIERPFAMFSDTKKSTPKTVNSIQSESFVESEPMMCGQVEKSSPEKLVAPSGDKDKKHENESEKDRTLIEEPVSAEEVTEITVLSQGNKNITLTSSQSENGCNDDTLKDVTTDKVDENEKITGAEKAEAKSENNANKADKYRSKRRSERVKILDNHSKSETKSESETMNNESTEEVSVILSSQAVSIPVDTSSQEDNSQSLFGSAEKVEIVEIQKKKRGRKKRVNTESVESKEVHDDSEKATGKSQKKQSMNKVTESSPVGAAEGLSDTKSKNTVRSDIVLARKPIRETFESVENKASNKNLKELSKKGLIKPIEDHEDQSVISLSDSDKMLSLSEEEDNISLIDLKKYSKMEATKATEKETEIESDDDVPLTDLKKISEKKTPGNSPQCDFAVHEKKDLKISKLTKKNVKRTTKQDRLKGQLKIDMASASAKNKPKPRSSTSPNAFMKIKLRRKSSDKLKLKKSSPKRKRRSKEIVSKKSQEQKEEKDNLESETLEAMETDIAMVTDSCEVVELLPEKLSPEKEKEEQEQVSKAEEIDKESQDKANCVDIELEEENDEIASHVVDQSAEKGEGMEKESTDDRTEAKTDQDLGVKIKDPARCEVLPSPVKKTGSSPQKSSYAVKSSPPKKGKPFDIPATPTSTVSKVMGMTRADYIFQKSRLLMGRQATTPSPLHRRSLRAVRSAFSEPRKRQSSILKKSPQGAESPVRTNQIAGNKGGSPPSLFRPVNLPQIYSPSASPSAGILKRRRISGDSPADSPSPPNKRRVSFAESVETRLFEKPRSRLNRPSSPRPVSRCLDMPKNMPSPLVTAEAAQMKDEEVTHTPDSVKSTQESQLNAIDPIYPSLVACDTPVEQILPQLTTSVWCRGLGQLLRGKSIMTVGQLSMLTEHQINSLPLRSPKIQVVRKALEEFAKSWLSAKKEDVIVDALDSSIDSDPGILETSGDLLDEIKQLEDEIEDPTADTNPCKLAFQPELQDKSPEKEDNTTMATRTNTEEETVGDNRENAESSVKILCFKKSSVELNNEGDFERKLKRQSIFNGIRSLHDLFTTEELSKLSSHSLVQIQTELNSMMSNVVSVLQNKVPLSPSSKE